MLHKNFELLETKADGNKGEFTAIVSTFGNVDRVGDRIMPGAWTKTLAQWEKSGDPIPLILAHQWEDPFAHVGVARPEDVKQTAKGLQVTGTLDIEDNPVAKQVYRLMQRRSLKEFSIGYNVPRGGEKRAKDGANEITEIELAECGPCLKGIDPKTELQAVKSALAVADLPDPVAQRAETRKVEREVEETQVPDVPTPDPEPQPVEEPKPLELAEPPRDAKTLRRESKRVALDLERERNEERIAALPALPEPEPDPPTPDLTAMIAEVKAELADTKRLLEEATKPPPVDVKAQREQAARAARELEEQKLPNVPAPEPAPQVDVGKELQDIKSQLTETREALQALKQKADEADKEPSRARSVDPLRKQAEAEALEFASGGQSQRKPPQTAPPKRPEPALSLRELKQRTRDEMLGVLSGGNA